MKEKGRDTSMLSISDIISKYTCNAFQAVLCAINKNPKTQEKLVPTGLFGDE